jgi:UDP-N-acetylglucosamine 4-epimerase
VDEQVFRGGKTTINGDGETSRDFCFIDNAVQANLLAAGTKIPEALNKVYNVAFGERTTLNDLFQLIKKNLVAYRPSVCKIEPEYSEFREGDVRHSLADISRARDFLRYDPKYDVENGLRDALKWYVRNANLKLPSQLESHGEVALKAQEGSRVRTH